MQKRITTTTSPPQLNHKRSELINRRNALLTAFSDAATEKRGKRLKKLYRRICDVNEFIGTLDEISVESLPPQPQLASGRRKFTVSSLFLHECYRKLTADKDEQFIFITGAETGGTCVLDQLIELTNERRTMLGVTAEPRATHRILIRLEQFKHKLLAHFHSHPGNGAESTHPSGIDRDFQKRLESAGHVAVCAIFSRDGFIRFLRLDNNFDIEIYGEGVQRHEQNVYRLTNLD
jgi:hypothetical protein